MQSAPIAPETDATLHGVGVDNESTVDPPVTDELVEDELLIEEISIDGMCGVY